MLTGNKGEWSEIYVLFKLLAEGKLYAADEHLRKLENLFFPVFKVVRSEAQSSVHEYISENSVPECNPEEKVRICVDGKEVACVLRDKFRIESAVLLNELSDSRKKGSFPVERTETFMKDIACGQIKAKTYRYSHGISSRSGIQHKVPNRRIVYFVECGADDKLHI